MIRMNIATLAHTSEQENARSTTDCRNTQEDRMELVVLECASGSAEEAAKERT